MQFRKKQTLLTIILFLLICGGLSAQLSQKIDLRLEKATLKSFFTTIESKTEYTFMYRNLNLTAPVTIVAEQTELFNILNQVLSSLNLQYEVSGKRIILTERTAKSLSDKRTITGIITDTNGEPVIGANVIEKGTVNGVITDMDGSFSLSVMENAVLQISYIGYTPQEVVIHGQSTISVVLSEDMQSLDEVVVIGYGVQKRVNLTGAVASVNSKTLSKRQIGQTSLALQGAAPGVTVTQRSGQPGSDGGDIRIRGIGTLNNSNPLVLVDGLEMGINNIDVSTIESISVLKDAASSSIYGSKAANGVILITTKRATEGKFNVAYSGYISQQKATRLPEKLNALDHILLLNEAKVNSGAGVLYTDEQIQAWRENSPSDAYPDTDWQKEVLKGNGLLHNHSLTLTGGTDKLKVLASIGYLGQNGIIKNVHFERISMRLNTDFKFSKNFSSSLDVFVYNSGQNSPTANTGNLFLLMNKIPSVVAARYANGNYGEGDNGTNPVARINEAGFSKRKSTPMTANLLFKWQPVKEFWMQTAFSPSISYPLQSTFVRRIATYYANGNLFSELPAKAQLTERSDYTRYLQSRTTAHYIQTIKNHTISALAGFQYEYDYDSNFNAGREDFPFPDYTVLNAGSVENMTNGGTASENALVSWFGRANYDYKSKYLFEANIRYDGSSKFASGNKWGVFPSFSAGWRLSEEFFWDNLRNMVPNLKLRGSWGTLGNQNIGSNYPFSSNINMSTKYISGDRLIDGASVLTMNNPDINWETTTMTNVGLDFNITHKINVTFDWYYKKTKDILMTLDIPQTMGLEPTYQNAGVVENKGYDINITYTDKVGDFDFDISFNFSDVKNKIVDLKGINETGTVSNREGYAINSFYLRKSLGILTSEDFNSDGSYKWTPQVRPLAPGDLRYINLNDDDLINNDDREVLGSTIPRYTYGFNFNGRYKDFDLNILLQGVGKVDGYLTFAAVLPFSSGSSAFEIHKDHWTEENQNINAAFPRLYFNDTNNYYDSDFYMRSAAYLRAKNLQMGYKVPTSISRKMLMEHLRFYVSGENLFTLTNFWKGWDPEVSPASEGSYYPQVRTISFGIDVRF